MPCISYDTEWVSTNPRRTHTETVLKIECDRLARIACKAMATLEQLDPELNNFNSFADSPGRVVNPVCIITHARHFISP